MEDGGLIRKRTPSKNIRYNIQLTYEELNTVLVRCIEIRLNSPPLILHPRILRDLSVLTQAHTSLSRIL